VSLEKKCPACGEPLERQPNKYFWRGVYMHGWICVPCNSLWDIGGAFVRYVKKRSTDARKT